jgi:hypothetical protein
MSHGTLFGKTRLISIAGFQKIDKYRLQADAACAEPC